MDNRTVSVGQTPLYHEIYSSITSCRLNGRARHKVNGLLWVCLFIIVLWAVAWSFFSSGFFLLQPQAPQPPPPSLLPLLHCGISPPLRSRQSSWVTCTRPENFHQQLLASIRSPNHWLRDRLGWQETCAAAVCRRRPHPFCLSATDAAPTPPPHRLSLDSDSTALRLLPQGSPTRRSWCAHAISQELNSILAIVV